jgi:hypothetical protein
MNLSTFLDHWAIVENPFRGEEARHDPVFLRLGAADGAAADGRSAGGPAVGLAGHAGAAAGIADGRASVAEPRATTHADFEKIAGDFDRPSTSIVFGEKGSGKTAIRLQLAERIAAHNLAHPDRRCLLVAYDDLNPILDRFHARFADDRRRGSTTDVFKRFRLVDHMDAIIGLVVQRLVNALLDEPGSGHAPGRAVAAAPADAGGERLSLGAEPRKTARRMDPALRRDLLLLQAVYDRAAGGGVRSPEERTARLRRLLRLPLPSSYRLWTALAYAGWLLPVAAAVTIYRQKGLDWSLTERIVVGAAIVAWLLVLFKRSVVDRLAWLRLAHRVRRQVRVSARSDRSYGRSLRMLDDASADSSVLPTTDSDEQRYAMLDRLRRVLAAFGYATMIIVIDRIDEPTLISGDPERMQAIIWPLLNNKFLTQPGIGVKMLLPMELRHSLFRESAAFFQEARLDKQNLIERLNWSGAMLYDLCSARLAACRRPGAEPIALIDLFAEDVTRQDLVDALDQMHQPRDAFKMLYQCLTEHCSLVTEDNPQWKIPRLVLQSVLKEQAERVRQLYRGVRPA